MKIWLIMKRTYEYNDETYDMTEGGNVIVSYGDRSIASIALEQKMIDSVRTGETYMYYSWDHEEFFIYSEEFVKLLNGFGYEYKDLGSYSAYEEIAECIQKASDDEIKLFVKHLVSPLYYLESTELS
jgi:hypothetical protein